LPPPATVFISPSATTGGVVDVASFRCADGASVLLKAAGPLQAICRAWARCRIVSEVRYYAPPHVARAVSRAVSVVHANDHIRILSLDDALKEAPDDRLAA
jgi:hypothetical protein